MLTRSRAADTEHTHCLYNLVMSHLGGGHGSPESPPFEPHNQSVSSERDIHYRTQLTGEKLHPREIQWFLFALMMIKEQRNTTRAVLLRVQCKLHTTALGAEKGDLFYSKPFLKKLWDLQIEGEMEKWESPRIIRLSLPLLENIHRHHPFRKEFSQTWGLAHGP